MSILGKLYSPYQKAEKDTMKDFYREYLYDDTRYLFCAGKHFSKIICRCECYIKEGFNFLLIFEPIEKITIGDFLVDERGNEFVVKSFEMIRFTDEIPEWYFKTVSIFMQGKSYDIGSYLRKKD